MPVKADDQPGRLGGLTSHRFCYARAKEAQGVVAVVATLSKGYDLKYIWKQVDRGPAKDAASYFIQASESGGEPPGRWWGPAANTLGFEPGQRIEREPYDLLFGERKGPDGSQLGRLPNGGRKAADLYVEAPKNRKRRRTIYPVRTPAGYPLAERLAARLEQARAEQAAGANLLGLVFPSPTGKHWRSSNYCRQVLKPAYLTAGWRDADGDGRWTWHSLRHVLCTTARAGSSRSAWPGPSASIIGPVSMAPPLPVV